MRFGHGPILVQINLQHSQAQPYGICTRVIQTHITQNHLYVEHHTEKQLVPFLKSLLWLGLGWVRTIDLPNSLPLHYRVVNSSAINKMANSRPPFYKILINCFLIHIIQYQESLFCWNICICLIWWPMWLCIVYLVVMTLNYVRLSTQYIHHKNTK